MTERLLSGEFCPFTERKQGFDTKPARYKADFAHRNRGMMCKIRTGNIATWNPVESHRNRPSLKFNHNPVRGVRDHCSHYQRRPGTMKRSRKGTQPGISSPIPPTPGFSPRRIHDLHTPAPEHPAYSRPQAHARSACCSLVFHHPVVDVLTEIIGSNGVGRHEHYCIDDPRNSYANP